MKLFFILFLAVFSREIVCADNPKHQPEQKFEYIPVDMWSQILKCSGHTLYAYLYSYAMWYTFIGLHKSLTYEHRKKQPMTLRENFWFTANVISFIALCDIAIKRWKLAFHALKVYLDGYETIPLTTKKERES